MSRPRKKNPVASGIRTRDLSLSRRSPYPLGQRGGQVNHRPGEKQTWNTEGSLPTQLVCDVVLQCPHQTDDLAGNANIALLIYYLARVTAVPSPLHLAVSTFLALMFSLVSSSSSVFVAFLFLFSFAFFFFFFFLICSSSPSFPIPLPRSPSPSSRSFVV